MPAREFLPWHIHRLVPSSLVQWFDLPYASEMSVGLARRVMGSLMPYVIVPPRNWVTSKTLLPQNATSSYQSWSL